MHGTQEQEFLTVEQNINLQMFNIVTMLIFTWISISMNKLIGFQLWQLQFKANFTDPIRSCWIKPRPKEIILINFLTLEY